MLICARCAAVALVNLQWVVSGGRSFGLWGDGFQRRCFPNQRTERCATARRLLTPTTRPYTRRQSESEGLNDLEYHTPWRERPAYLGHPGFGLAQHFNDQLLLSATGLAHQGWPTGHTNWQPQWCIPVQPIGLKVRQLQFYSSCLAPMFKFAHSLRGEDHQSLCKHHYVEVAICVHPVLYTKVTSHAKKYTEILKINKSTKAYCLCLVSFELQDWGR